MRIAGSLLSNLAILFPLAVVGCAHSGSQGNSELSPAVTAQAEVAPLGESQVKGKVTFTQLADGGVKVSGKLSGLTPRGLHGFHVHEKGDCSAPDGTSAGPHFNPGDRPHGDVHTDASHAGDLGNIQADADGNADFTIVKPTATLGGDDNSFVGRSIIVHAKADDLTSQPAGESGGRVACGVVQPE